MTTTHSRQTHLDHVLIEVTSFLLEHARMQLERDASTDPAAAGELQRLQALEKELHALRREFHISEPAAPGRQVSKFYEVPGQEDA